MNAPHPRTIARDAARKADLTRIHIAKAQLHLTDDQYRGILHDVCGVASAKDLDARGRGKLIGHMRKLGWAGSKPRTNVDGKPASAVRPAVGGGLSKIRAVWLQLHALGVVRDPDERALAAFCKRQTGVDLLQWLKGDEPDVMIESLKKWAMRYLPDLCAAASAMLGAPVLGRLQQLRPQTLADLTEARHWRITATASYDSHLAYLEAAHAALRELGLPVPLAPAGA